MNADAARCNARTLFTPGSEPSRIVLVVAIGCQHSIMQTTIKANGRNVDY
jgi:hypothetical protein